MWWQTLHHCLSLVSTWSSSGFRTGPVGPHPVGEDWDTAEGPQEWPQQGLQRGGPQEEEPQPVSPEGEWQRLLGLPEAWR